MPESSRRAELRLAQARDVARDLLGPELGVARDHRELLDVDRRVAVVGHDALGDQDRVLVVVAVPGHERDQHVLPERQLAHVGRRAVGDDVAAGDAVAHLDQRALVDVGVLVGTLVLDQVVDVDADLARRRLRVVHAHDDARARRRSRPGRRGAPSPRCRSRRPPCARRPCRPAASPGAGTAPPGAACSTHQRAVGVVVLEERDQRRGHRHDLRRRHVHVLAPCPASASTNSLWLRHDTRSSVELALLVDLGVRLRDHELAFLDRGQVVDLVGHAAVTTLRYGVSMKPYSLVRAYSAAS